MKTFSTLLRGCALVGSLLVVACKMPVSKSAYYDSGFLKESYSAYSTGGQEVKHGLYTRWFPNGEKELEIWYQDGREISKTFYDQRGLVVGTLELAQSDFTR